jgi:iron complex outermembrane receptor protein
VSQLKTGSGISKPVIHGLYGNRVALLNNGIAQGGQQWGNDHAPEVDAYSADHISVIKGVSSLAYAGQSLGGVVLIEPEETTEDPHFHGGLNYIYQTNGKGSTMNAKLEKGGASGAFWVKGTLKYHGDLHTPDYFLTNTGKREQDLAALLEIDKQKNWTKSLYFSTFNTHLGILRGAHIGNLTDLNSAIGREIPFFTSDSFSYTINSPSQKVNHHLIKLSTIGKLSKERIVHVNYGFQLNSRREFDVRRGGRSDEPALSLKQYTQQLDFSFEKSMAAGGYLKTGVLGQYIDNTNLPETGILPLIPDYLNFNEGVFLIYQKEWSKWTAEAGVRGNFAQYRVVSITRTLPREIERNNHSYANYSFSGGLNYIPYRWLRLTGNTGWAGRPPAINELYSFGLHQGVSSIEIGSPDLQVERAFKATLSAEVTFGNRLFAQILGYYQHMNDYIFLQPSAEPELTIRGAFPVFNYNQTDAVIKGLDLLFSFEPSELIRFISKASWLRGDDVRNGLPLVYMPSANLENKIEVNLKGKSIFDHPSVYLQWNTVFEQKHLNPEQDFLPPPPTYHLVEMGISSSFKIDKQNFNAGIQIDNLLNTTYRDYLNRQRYFSAETGRSFNMRVNWQF